VIHHIEARRSHGHNFSGKTNFLRFALPGLCVFGLVAGARLSAQSPDSTPTQRARSSPVLTIYFENDVFNGTDRHYTAGEKISWISADLTEWGWTGWRKDIVDALPFVNRPEGQKNVGVAFGQKMYTPQNLTLRTPDPKDQPYAGWTYLELAFISKTPVITDTLAIQFGLVGPDSYAKQTQDVVHQLIGDKKAQGWAHQLHNEPGVNLIYERSWRIYARTLDDILGVDLVPRAGACLGNVLTYANAGGILRFGFNLPSDFGIQLASPGSIGSAPADDLDPRVSPSRNFSLFVFTAVDGRAVARDIFLDGNTFRSSPSVDKEPFVADLSAGLGFIAGRWQFTFTQVRRTREFKTQRQSHDDFGSLTVSRAF
jgi:lipid A 3-O-deacylase